MVRNEPENQREKANRPRCSGECEGSSSRRRVSGGFSPHGRRRRHTPTQVHHGPGRVKVPPGPGSVFWSSASDLGSFAPPEPAPVPHFTSQHPTDHVSEDH